MMIDTARCPSYTTYLRPCGPDTYLDYCTTCLRPFVIAPMPFRTAGPRTYTNGGQSLSSQHLTLRLKNRYRSVMPPQAQPSKIYWKAFNGIMCMMLAIVGLIY